MHATIATTMRTDSGTNPVCFAFPAGEAGKTETFVIDIATAVRITHCVIDICTAVRITHSCC